MAAAWQMTVDMRLGLFQADSEEGNPLAVEEGKILAPNPPFIAPHNVWTKVMILYMNKNTINMMVHHGIKFCLSFCLCLQQIALQTWKESVFMQ